MEELTDLLQAATAAIEEGYFRLTIHGGEPVYRERVYCYELYHQMRMLWPEDCTFCLNGEVDKTAHPTLAKLGAAGYKPDLLVHRPGDMAGNHAIIEVKSARAAYRGFPKDLETLAVFRKAVGYARAIYLVYGEGIDDTLIGRIAGGMVKLGIDVPIELWLHIAPGDAAFPERELTPPGAPGS